MSFMKWSPELSVGIGAMDRDHQVFFSILGELFELIKVSRRPEQMHGLFERLERYATDHFKREEDLMRRYKYPQYEHHRQLHIQFQAVVRGLRKSYDEKSETACLELFESLDAWVYHHVAREDKAYALFFKEQDLLMTPVSTKHAEHPRACQKCQVEQDPVPPS